MKTQKLIINGIPAILWGDKSDKIYIHVHGKMSCKENAKAFAMIANEKGFQTLSFDLPEHGEREDTSYRCDIWNGISDLSKISDYAFSNWKDVSLFACSLGAFFSLHAYCEKNYTNCLFQSPVLDMEYLIKQMFVWFNVTEEKLQREKEIPTPIDTLRWDYYQYVVANPIKKWHIPTSILYGAKDNLQSIEIIENFANDNNCKVTISQNSEHAFMENADIPIVSKWLQENI